MVLCVYLCIIVTMNSAHAAHVGGKVQYHGGISDRGDTSGKVAQISMQKLMTNSFR